MASWEPDKSGRDVRIPPGGTAPDSPPQDPDMGPSRPVTHIQGSDLPVDEGDPLPDGIRPGPGTGHTPSLYEVSSKEREDEQRRHRDEFDDNYFCADPFGEWIQSILDDKKGEHGAT